MSSSVGSGIVLLGTQWGDEGKGKMSDALMANTHLSVRYQGGANAGHTIVIGDDVKILQLLPAGILRDETHAALGNAVVIDPWHIQQEIQQLVSAERDLESFLSRLHIDGNATLVLPVHKELDVLAEQNRTQALGTTKRGIGPANEDRTGRRAIRVEDLTNTGDLRHKLSELMAYHKVRFNAVSEAGKKDQSQTHAQTISDSLSVEKNYASLMAVAPLFEKTIADVGRLVFDTINAGKNVLLEGAQGYLLDLSYGSYPYVTSSQTQAASAAVGAGIPFNCINKVIGIVKAYQTRVGEGPFPTELDGEMAEYLGRVGKEFGANTGRARRCGWLDLPLLKESVWRNGVTDLCLTKMDVLEGLDTVCIATSHTHKGKSVNPGASGGVWDGLDTKYREFSGWKHDVVVESRETMHANAQRFIDFIEAETGVPVSFVSTGPRRDQICGLNTFFERL